MFNRSISGLAVCLLALPVLAGDFSHLSDPTRPYQAEVDVADERKPGITIKRRLVVESVLISPTRRVVVINGTSLREGDFLNELQVTAIEADLVSVREGEKEFQLKPVTRTSLVVHSS